MDVRFLENVRPVSFFFARFLEFFWEFEIRGWKEVAKEHRSCVFGEITKNHQKSRLSSDF